jgi:hypothetical protein
MTASDPALRPSAAGVAESLSVTAPDAPVDPTAVLPVASDVTAAVPVYAAASPTAAVPAARARPFDRRRLGVPLIAAGVVALLLLLDSAFGAGAGIDVPATGASSTTVTSVPPTTRAAQTIPPPASPTTQKGKGKGNGDHQGGGGD